MNHIFYESEDSGAEDDSQGPFGDEENEVDGEKFFAVSLEPPLEIRNEFYHYHFYVSGNLNGEYQQLVLRSVLKCN